MLFVHIMEGKFLFTKNRDKNILLPTPFEIKFVWCQMSQEASIVCNSGLADVNWKYVKAREKNLPKTPDLGGWGWIPGVTAAVAAVHIVVGAGSLIETIHKVAASAISYALDTWLFCSKKDDAYLAERKVKWLHETDSLGDDLKHIVDTIAMSVLYAIPFIGYYAQKLVGVLDLALQTMLKNSSSATPTDEQETKLLNEQLEKQLVESAQLLEEREKEIKRIALENKDLFGEVTRQKEALKATTDEILMSRQKIALLTMENTKTGDTISQLQALLKEKISEIEKVSSASLAEKKLQLKEIEGLKIKNQKQIDELTLENARICRKIAPLEAQLKDKTAEVEKISSEKLVEKEQQLKEIENLKIANQQKIDSLVLEKAKICESLRQAEALLNDKTTDIEKSSLKNLAEKERQLKESEQLRIETQRKLELLSLENTRINIKVQHLEIMMKDKTADLERIAQEKSKIERQLEEKSASPSENQPKDPILLEKINELTKMQLTLQTEISGHVRTIANQEQEISTLKTNTKQLQEDIEDSIKERNKLFDEVVALKKELKKRK